jgi:SAM-dependent methyltransferase
MRLRGSFVSLFAAGCLAVAATSLVAQPAPDYAPQVGQDGKDVIWVPTPQSVVDRMLDMAGVGPGDVVVDLGSGDGRTVIGAAKRGATALGIEYNDSMVELSRRNAAKAGVAEKAAFIKGDIFESDFSKATVVTMFLLPMLNLKLRPAILSMAPGTRIVSNTFDMGDWKADATAQVTTDCTTYCRAFLWVVPAKVGGTWQFGAGQLSVQQSYQFFSGLLSTGNVVAPITDGRIVGDRITFTAGDTRYSGQVKGNRMEGISANGGTEAPWQAIRSGAGGAN